MYMSKFIRNLKLKNSNITTNKGVLKFDDKGIAQVDSDELYDGLLGLKGYEKVDGQDDGGENSIPPVTPPAGSEGSEGSEGSTPNGTPGQPNTEEDSGEGNDNGESDQEPEGLEHSILTDEQLEAFTIKQLQHHAKVNNIDLTGKSKKDEIVEAIKESQAK
jgi:hypothetical protein